MLTSSENRVLDCLTSQPEVAPLAAAELFTTYGLLKSLVKEELDRIGKDRVVYHDNHTLLVRCVFP